LNVMLTNGCKIEGVKQIKMVEGRLWLTFEDEKRASVPLQERSIYLIY
jgi:coenzyme F420-reducing hydrogenase beta subunit